jgi:hypothetical protein
MSYHILHLLSHSLRVRIKLDQLHITDSEKGTDKTVPLADVAVIVCAARDTEFSSSSLRRMIIMRSQQRAEAEKMPSQMQFF